MSGLVDGDVEVTADRTWRMATLRIAGEEFSVVVPAKDADRLASALSDSAERVEAAKAEGVVLRERIEATEREVCDCREAVGHLTRCRWLIVRSALDPEDCGGDQ